VASNISSELTIPRLFTDSSINSSSPCSDLYGLIYNLYLLYYNLLHDSGKYNQAFQAFQENSLIEIELLKPQIIAALNNPVVCASSAKIGLAYLESTQFYQKAYTWGQAQWAADYAKGYVTSPTFDGFKSFIIEILNNLNSSQIAQLYQCKENMVALIYQTVFVTSNTVYAANGQELLTLIPKINQFYADMIECLNVYFTDNDIPDEYFNIIYENYLNSDPYAIPIKKPIVTNINPSK